MSLPQATSLAGAGITFLIGFLGVFALVRPESRLSRIWWSGLVHEGRNVSDRRFATRLGVVYAGSALVGVAFVLEAIRGEGSSWSTAGMVAFIPGMLLVVSGWLSFMRPGTYVCTLLRAGQAGVRHSYGYP